MQIRAMTRAEIVKTYETRMTADFPADELKSLAQILDQRERGRYTALGCYAGEDLAAYAMNIGLADNPLLLIDYLAVEQTRRGQGIGSWFLARVESEKPLAVEVEDPDDAEPPQLHQRLRRIAFYERCGFRTTGVRVVLFGVQYRIMIKEGACPLGDDVVQASLTAIYRRVIDRDCYEQNVRFISSAAP